ncbi:MAG: GNAT family N-acetyltransferase [Sterolibacterium sp.]|jgi:GNAT superfamily N-acetyltransferase
MDIRPLAKDDLPALLRLYRHLHSSDAPLPSQGEIDAVWTEIVSSDRFRYFGSFVGGALVSSCTISIIPNLTRGCKPYGVIENVVTHADHRRRGYGTDILRFVLTHAWSAGCYKVMLLTGRKDDSTLRFYRSAGFDPDEKHAFIAKPPASLSLA